MDPSARFLELVAGVEAGSATEGALPLDELAMLIAAHAHPGLDVPAQLARLDDLAGQAGEPTLDGLCRLLFRDLGFAGNDVEYYDARNSYLDDVLDRRTGIPISLAVVTMEVGRRLGVPLWGVSMPGHFLVRDKVDPEVFVDPFNRGVRLDQRGCRLRFQGVHGAGATFDDAYLEPVGKVAIVDRMLANLETIARTQGETFTLIWVLELRVALPSAGPEIEGRLAAALGAGGRLLEAATVLDRLAAGTGDPAAALAAEQAAQAMRARLN